MATYSEEDMQRLRAIIDREKGRVKILERLCEIYREACQLESVKHYEFLHNLDSKTFPKKDQNQ